MALPTSYLTTTKNLEAILAAIQGAQAPEKFAQSFLENLEFKSSSDRLIIGVLKSLGFLDDGGKPTERYFRYLDQTQSAKVLAEGIREAYADLFRVNVKANELARPDVIQKFKTLGQGQLSDPVLEKMGSTFVALVKHADFDTPGTTAPVDKTDPPAPPKHDPVSPKTADPALKIGGLVYNIQIVLPESRDPAVYDALFSSLRRHLA